MTHDSFYRRRGRAMLIVATLLLPLIGWGVQRAIRSNSNDVRDWLPAEYPETQEFSAFTRDFGVQDFIVASWPGCTLVDERLDRFARYLEERRPAESTLQPFSQIVTGRSLIQRLAEPPLELDKRVTRARLQGSIVGPDGMQTCAILTLRDEAAEQLEPTLAWIEEAATASGVPQGELRVGGIPVVNAALNRESTASLVRLAGLSGLLGVIVAWLCFRDLRLTSLVLASGVYSAAAALAVVPLCGVPLNAILITMVPLVYVTGISGAIHLSNYYLEAARDGSLSDAPGKAVAHAAVPLFLAGVTTAVGLLSLCYSELAPIRLFGIFSAIGVVIGSMVQFTVLPAALAVWAPAPRSPVHTEAGGSHEGPSQLTLFPRLGDWVTSRPVFVSFACLAVMLFLAAGLPKIETSIQMMRLFSPRASVIPMTQWLEQNLGATIPLEVLVTFDLESDTSRVKRMAVVAAIDGQLRKLPKAGGSISAATFAPREITSSIPLRPLQRAVIEAKIKQQYDVLHEHGWISRHGEQEIWRISLRIRGIDDVDYSQLAETLRGRAEQVLTERLGAGHPGVGLAITGTAPIVFRARRSLLDGMLFGLGTDVVLIVVAVMVTTRSLLTGGVMLILSIFPTTLVFGAMGWAGVVVDIGSVMTPCVAVGVTVDDVIHFLLCHRRGVQQGLSVRDASNLAYRTCGRAMIQSWGIIGVGLSAFALSSFVPTFRFGLLMLLLLTAGLVGNLLFLPAVLASPIGRWVSRKPLHFADRVHVGES